MSTHHNRWKESILAHNIIDICHRPGIKNPVADGLSRVWRNRQRTQNDGSHWSVLPDWETTRGISNDVMSISTLPLDMSTPQLLPHELEAKFKGDIFFEPIVYHLLGRDTGSNITERRKAKHRAQGFMIERGKLWRLSSKASDRVSRTECIPRNEGFALALETHKKIGHFKSVDILKLHLHEHYFWPGMDADCRQVALECPECKHFGPSFHNALLQPIHRSRPFALICGDYLSLPNGHGGYKQIGLYIDVYLGFIWATKLKAAGTAKSTVKSLQRIVTNYATPDVFMADGGKHFDNGDVNTFCTENGVEHITTAAYAPWCNGLIEGTNKLLLGHLRRLCAPNMDQYIDDDVELDEESIPKSWPLHLDEAIRQLNDRIRPNILRSPRELLFGLAITPKHRLPMKPTDIPETSPTMVSENIALADMLRMNAHLLQLEVAEQQKSAWDDRTPAINFEIDDIVQIYNTKLDSSYNSTNKLLPKWSTPHIITAKFLNSYSLSTLNGTPISGSFHSRRLRPFILLRGSNLDLMSKPTSYPNDPNSYADDVADAEERMAERTDGLLTSATDPREPLDCGAD